MELLSVCVAHCRRSYFRVGFKRAELFPRCVDSLCASLAECGQPAELVVADWPYVSQDGPLHHWLLDRATIPVRVIKLACEFSPGLGRNEAAKASQGSRLFFLDADMLVVPEVIRRGLQCAAAGRGFFPFYKRQLAPESFEYADGRGTGNSIVQKAQWCLAGGFPESTGYDGEDTAFWHWFNARRLAVREPIPGFLHMWHPDSEIKTRAENARAAEQQANAGR